MFGSSFAAAELGLRHEIWDLQAVPEVDQAVITPFIHYHTPIKFHDGRRWYKRDGPDSCCKFPWPVPKGTSNTTREALSRLRSAHARLGETRHAWPPDFNTPES
uniref:Uncharacterized protein n=1 Tax=Cryptomonas curvata TaxID=233186 RepID=A0A7S0M602_9CRYP